VNGYYWDDSHHRPRGLPDPEFCSNEIDSCFSETKAGFEQVLSTIEWVDEKPQVTAELVLEMWRTLSKSRSEED
jgi:hypothetical protein